MKTILTLTLNPAVDKSTSIDHVVPEHKLRCANPEHEPGGGGINVSRAIKHLGGQSTALYTMGGLTGRLLESLLQKEGIPHRAVPIREWTRESLAVFEESTNLQYRFNMEGPTLQEGEWTSCLDMVSRADPKPDYVVGSGVLPPGVPGDFYARLARVGRELGARVIVDTSGDPLRLALEGRVFMIKPNIRELNILAGREPKDEAEQESVVMELVGRAKSDMVVVSLGAAGVLLATADGCMRLRAPLVPIKSKVGAGDSMVGAITLRLALGYSIQDSVRYGVAAGTAAVTTPGTQLCGFEDTGRLLANMRL
jgi:6-phosphofructokinase 2